jgi:hypothetical protein
VQRDNDAGPWRWFSAHEAAHVVAGYALGRTPVYASTLELDAGGGVARFDESDAREGFAELVLLAAGQVGAELLCGPEDRDDDELSSVEGSDAIRAVSRSARMAFGDTEAAQMLRVAAQRVAAAILTVPMRRAQLERVAQLLEENPYGVDGETLRIELQRVRWRFEETPA